MESSSLKFEYGLEHLGLGKTNDSVKALLRFQQNWNKNPDKQLNFRHYSSPNILEKNGYAEFPSVLMEALCLDFTVCANLNGDRDTKLE